MRIANSLSQGTREHQVVPTGRIPEGNRLPVTTAAPPNVAALGSEASVTIWFALAPEEAELAKERGVPQLETLTARAVGHLGALLMLDPSEGHLIEEVEPFGRRIGRGYGQLARLLSDYQVDADWYSDLVDVDEVDLEPARTAAIAEALLEKELGDPTQVTVDGFLWDVATGDEGSQRFVKIQSGSRQIKATYATKLARHVLAAQSHMVTARLRVTAFRYPFALSPHRREWELLEITEVGGSAGALREAEEGDPG